MVTTIRSVGVVLLGGVTAGARDGAASTGGSADHSRGLDKSSRSLDNCSRGLDKSGRGLDKSGQGVDKSGRGAGKSDRGVEKNGRGLDKSGRAKAIQAKTATARIARIGTASASPAKTHSVFLYSTSRYSVGYFDAEN